MASALCLGMAYAFSRILPMSDPIVLFAMGICVLCGAVGLLGAVVSLAQECWIAYLIYRAENPEPIFGKARFATLREACKAGLTDPEGLFIGLLGGTPLFKKVKSHLLTVAPPRSGKGLSAVVPAMLHFMGSLVVIDPKGELAAMTAKHRAERLGQDVFLLNPHRILGLGYHYFNPLAIVVFLVRHPLLVKGAADEVRRIVLQLLPEPEHGGNNAYFRNGSRKLLRAIILHLATWADGARCTLPEVWRILTSDTRLRMCIEQMCQNEALGGIIQDMGDDFAALMPKEREQFADFKEGALQAVDIFDPSGWLGEMVSRSDFALSDLKEKKTTVIVVIPQELMAVYAPFLALLTRQTISAISMSKGREEVLLLLDEFGSIGKIKGLVESLTGLPGLGVKVWMIVQSLEQLVGTYGRQMANTILAATEVKQFFRVPATEAPIISRWLGQQTVVTRSHNLGRYWGDMPSQSLAATGRPLLEPEEIVAMKPEEQLLFVDGLRPIRGERGDYRAVRPWSDWAEDNPTETRPVGRIKRQFTMRYR